MPALVPARRFDPELMDRPDNSPAELEAALRDLRLVNRWLGGGRALLRALDPWLDAATDGRPLEVLDVGTGGADLPLAMVRHARARGRAIRITAVDRDPVTASIARRETAAYPDVRVLCADARELPFEPRSFDLVTASLFLHHFRAAEIVELLRGFRRLARRAVLVNDLRRHVVPWSFIRVVGRLTARSRMFLHDAPLSVLRGFTPGELREIVREAGIERAEVRRRWPYRLLLTLPGDGAAA